MTTELNCSLSVCISHSHTHAAESFLLSLELPAQPSKAATQIWPGVGVWMVSGWVVQWLIFSGSHGLWLSSLCLFVCLLQTQRTGSNLNMGNKHTDTGSNDDKMITYEVFL